MDNQFGINIYHKIHGINYGTILPIHVIGQKTTIYFIFSYTTLLQELITTYFDGQIKSKLQIMWQNRKYESPFH